jgi:hypothetical protein
MAGDGRWEMVGDGRWWEMGGGGFSWQRDFDPSYVLAMVC